VNPDLESSPFWSEVVAFIKSLTPESDRGIAVLSAAFIDMELEKLLTRFFVDAPAVTKDLLGQSRPIGTFSSRIDLCFAVGLIGKATHRNLHLVRKVRNDFAHSGKPLKFSEPQIAARCREFAINDEETKPRMRFSIAALQILGDLHAAFVSTEPRGPKLNPPRPTSQ
jgi:DNA-binding MltR family transcriptional regulator